MAEISDKQVRIWASAQRLAAKRGAMPESRRIQLDAVGFDWAGPRRRANPKDAKVKAAYKIAIKKRGNNKCKRGHTLTFENIRPSALMNRQRLECDTCKRNQQTSWAKKK
jgi:hypothetical protein